MKKFFKKKNAKKNNEGVKNNQRIQKKIDLHTNKAHGLGKNKRQYPYKMDTIAKRIQDSDRCLRKADDISCPVRNQKVFTWR